LVAERSREGIRCGAADKTATTAAWAAEVAEAAEVVVEPDVEAETECWRSQWISFLKREIESV
jgi:hypothetical protein